MDMLLAPQILLARYDYDDEDDDGDGYDDDDDDDDDDGFPANSPHDKIPPWWEYVINR